MSSFFDYQCKFQRSLSNVYAWSRNRAEPILAVATSRNSNYSVVFFKEEGELMKDHSIKRVNRKGEAVCMTWHPTMAILACGWDDGVVSLWHMQERISREDNQCHRKHKVCLVKWSPDGSRLVTADTDGVIGVWSSDIRGRLTKRQDFNRFGALTHAVFIDTAPTDGRPEIHFMVAGKLGVVTYANGSHCANVLSLKSPVAQMMEGRGQGEALIITESLQLTMVHVRGDQFEVLKEVRLSAKWQEGCPLEADWVGPGILLVSSGEQLLRFWDSHRDQNYTLNIQSGVDDDAPPISRGDVVTSVDFSKQRGELVLGTREGHLMMWQFTGAAANSKGDLDGDGTADLWRVKYHKQIDGTRGDHTEITKVRWGNSRHLLAVAETIGSNSTVVVLNETHLQNRLSSTMTALQQSPDELIVHFQGFKGGSLGQSSKDEIVPVKCGLSIRGVQIDGDRFVAWGNAAAEVYEMIEDRAVQQSTFRCTGGGMTIRDENLFVINNGAVDVCSLDGVKQETISFSETEGQPCHIDINGNFMAIGTKKGYLKIFDVSRKGAARQLGSSARFLNPSNGQSIGMIAQIKVNIDGTRIAILVVRENNMSYGMEPSTQIYVYNSKINGVMSYEFGPKRYPREMHWDKQEPKLLVCESVKVPGYVEPESKNEKKQKMMPSGYGARGKMPSEQVDFPEGGQITTLFATTGFGLRAQDSFPINTSTTSLLGANVPYLYYVISDETHGGTKQTLKSELMRDFVGLDTVDDKIRTALIEFSYRLTIGQMDAAYRAVKAIDSPGIWENMLHMCVKTKRLDVAGVCLGNMSHARGAKIVRETIKKEGCFHPWELDASIAMVAIQLGMVKEAEKLYKNCQRYDLLNQLYQASGEWEKAVETAEHHDRINLRTTHYNYAKHLENVGEHADAIHHFEKAKAHWYEVPRMMYDANRMVELEGYINKSHNSKLLRWWGQYTESNQDLDVAQRYYELCNDTLSLVRIHCYRKEWSIAEDIVKSLEGDSKKAAAYHLATQFEKQSELEDDKVKPALEYYRIAGRYNHAIRLGFENDLDYEVLDLGINAPNKLLCLSAARKMEARGTLDKAVQLYQACGHSARALELCFKSTPPMFDLLKDVAKSLDEKTDPETLRKCSEFFMENAQYEKAMELCISTRNFDQALELAEKYNISITETMAEDMTMKKMARGEDGYKEHNAIRKKILTELAALAQKQGSFHIATKKFAEAGNSKKAMIALLQSGDTGRIITFAGLCRKTECYILAANYLQQVEDLHEKDEIVKNVIMFYTKARAFEQLGTFYNVVAEFEMNEWRNYDKAVVALQNAVKYMHDRQKGANGRPEWTKEPKKPEKLQKLRKFQEKLDLVSQFVQAKKLVSENPSQMISICEGLLKKPKIEFSLRVGDVLALLIEYYDHQKMMQDAMRCIQQMQLSWKLDLSVYLDEPMLKRIFEANGQRYGGARDSKEADEDDMDEEISDEMAEEIEED